MRISHPLPQTLTASRLRFTFIPTSILYKSQNVSKLLELIIKANSFPSLSHIPGLQKMQFHSEATLSQT